MVKPEVRQLQATKRDTLGSKSSEAIREGKNVPAVLYGPSVESNIHFSINELDLEKILATRQRLVINLVFEGGESYETIIKTADFDPVSDRPIHVDFYVMDEEKSFITMVPIKLVGKAKGATVGGKVVQNLRDAKVKVTKASLPAEVDVDVTHLDIGQTLKIKNIAPESFQILNDPQRTVVTIKASRAVVKK